MKSKKINNKKKKTEEQWPLLAPSFEPKLIKIQDFFEDYFTDENILNNIHLCSINLEITLLK